MRLLVIEDDARVMAYIQKGMAEAGHAVDTAEDGEKGLYLANSERYDVLIVDRMLPKLDGLSLIKSLRGSGNQTGVLILSALDDVDDRVMGLRSGGDDYLIKPFAFAELLARVEGLAARSRLASPTQQTTLTAGDLEMDLLARKVKRGGHAHHAAGVGLGLSL
jgi:two-component system, OmpR family, response regulator